jgi:hypothetical protein
MNRRDLFSAATGAIVALFGARAAPARTEGWTPEDIAAFKRAWGKVEAGEVIVPLTRFSEH